MGFFCQAEEGRRDRVASRGLGEGDKRKQKEVKFVENLNVSKADEQEEHDAIQADNGNMPIVAWKKSNQKWLVIMSADDFFQIYRESEWSEEYGS